MSPLLLLSLGGAGLGFYLMSQRQGNTQPGAGGVYQNAALPVGTKGVVAPNPNIGSLSRYPVPTDQLGQIIYGDNGPRAVDFINAANTSDIPIAPLATFNAKARPREARRNTMTKVQAQQIEAQKKVAGAQAAAYKNAAFVRVWPTLSEAERAAYVQNGSPLGLSGLDNPTINYYGGEMSNSPNYSMNDLVSMRQKVATATH